MCYNAESGNYKAFIDKTVDFVKEHLKNAEGGHDWYHIERVWKNALHIAKKEGAGNQLVIELGALLHDIADAKFNNGDETLGPRIAVEFMLSIGLSESTIVPVIEIIENISFRKQNKYNTIASEELKVVQDADRLDAMGAIGIARAFNYGGFKNRPLYETTEIDANGKSPAGSHANHTIGHFYEKLLLLKGLMNTRAGKEMAEERHAYMVNFLDEFFKEWEGER